MIEKNSSLVNARRRMRGIAVAFMIVSSIAAAGIAFLTWSGESPLAAYDLIGRAIVTFGLFCAALSTWHGSRIAAITLFMVLMISPVSAWAGTVEMTTVDWARSGIYILASLVAIVSTFQYRHYCEAGDAAVGGNSVIRMAGTLGALSVFLFLGFGSAVLANGLSTSILRESEVSEKHRDWLIEQKFLLKNERPIYLYFDGIFAMEEGGSLLSHDYVGGWWMEDGEIDSVWIPLGQVCEVKQVSEGSALSDAVYSVHSPGNEHWIQLWLSVEDGLHEHFISRMKSINRRKIRSEIQTFCDENRPIDWVEIAEKNGISQAIVTAAGVSEQQRRWLIEQKFLLDDESILQFYSNGTYSIAEEGVLLTDRYVGAWSGNDDQVEGWWYEFGSICSIQLNEDDSNDEKANYRITGSDADSWVKFSLPTKNGQAEHFIKTVRMLNQASIVDDDTRTCDASTDAVAAQNDIATSANPDPN